MSADAVLLVTAYGTAAMAVASIGCGLLNAADERRFWSEFEANKAKANG